MKKILLAEDDESVRKMVARVLESVGYDATQARSNGEAVAQFEKLRPDLLILELPSPDARGWQALEAAARSTCIPVIALTRWPDTGNQASRIGLAALFEKPLDLFALLKTIRALLPDSDELLAAPPAKEFWQVSA